MSRAREEAIFIGPSSGASLAAVAKTLPNVPQGSRILTFRYDTGERYLSVEGLFWVRCCWPWEGGEPGRVREKD